jgi:hypothetical protein
MVYEDQTTAAHSMLITQGWTESYANRPPNAVTGAVFPADGGAVQGTTFAFAWQPATDSDGDTVTDYEFVLSDQPGAPWPLSSNFHRLVSLTADAGHARYTLPYAGLLNSDTTYYWRVRPRDMRGAWGAWSAVYSFQTSTPHPPENVAVVVDAASRTASLTWTAAATGTAPVSYRVYGSDEKGFTVSDTTYKVYVGDQGSASTMVSPFASNFVATSLTTQYPVVGASANVNHAFYRVVAIDASGIASGPSDYAEVPRPLIFTQPASTGTVGQSYSYAAHTIASIGDVRAITLGSDGYATNYWDVEHPTFALTGAPAWLSVDATSGVVSGVPTASGTYNVSLVVTTPQLANAKDTQSFTITVQ